MHARTVCHAVGALLCCLAASMAVPLGVGLWYGDAGVWPLFHSMWGAGLAGSLLMLGWRRGRDWSLNHREGIAIVALGWFVAGVAGGAPYVLAGICDWTDAVFESVSGFTTTGASIFTDVEAVAPSLLFWRSFTHWLGGMGIIVLSLAVLPFLGVGGMQLYRAEVPGPTPDKLKPRIKDTAAVLWQVYLLLTVAQTALLCAGGMSLFDASTHTFATLATGGFSTRNASVGHYDSPFVQWTITIFMFLAGANFALHFKVLQGRPGALLRAFTPCWWLEPRWPSPPGCTAATTRMRNHPCGRRPSRWCPFAPQQGSPRPTTRCGPIWRRGCCCSSCFWAGVPGPPAAA